VPQRFIQVDREKVLKQGVALRDVYQTIQAYMGGLFINYFNDFGRSWQVYVEAEAPYRSDIDNLGQFYGRNSQGGAVPLTALANFEKRSGPEFTLRYNEYRAAQVNGSAAPGYSSDQATAALEQVFRQTMPSEMGFDYMGMSYQEQKARKGVSSWLIFGFSLVFVFLVLAALYESWSLPFSVLLSTPVAVFGAVVILWLRRVLLAAFLPAYSVQLENDVYMQIGLVMLIGLGAKNSILIVAFAKEEYERGKPLVEAALDAARIRFRPLMMTALAFIVGCIPLWIASGAGSIARQIIGTTVIGGMVAETFLVAATVRAGNWNCLTLVFYQGAVPPEVGSQLLARPSMLFAPPTVRTAWINNGQLRSLTPYQFGRLRLYDEKRKEFVRALHRGGARILLGTDTPNQYVVPGFAVHEELRNLVDVGFTPYEAISAATKEAAEFLKSKDKWGTIAVGMRADLILTTANPLEDVRNVSQQAGVMVRGRWLPQDELRASLERLAASYEPNAPAR
jgi:hypothetical protein